MVSDIYLNVCTEASYQRTIGSFPRDHCTIMSKNLTWQKIPEKRFSQIEFSHRMIFKKIKNETDSFTRLDGKIALSKSRPKASSVIINEEQMKNFMILSAKVR